MPVVARAVGHAAGTDLLVCSSQPVDAERETIGLLYLGGGGQGRMDPVTLIVTALAAGAASALQDGASAAVKDAYARLKALVKKRFADRPKDPFTGLAVRE